MKSVASLREFVESSVQCDLDRWNRSVEQLDELEMPQPVRLTTDSGVEQLLDDILYKLKNNDGEINGTGWKELFTKVFGCEPGFIFSDPYKRASLDFIRKARAFDQHITLEEMYQALRNLWIANSIQCLLNLDAGTSEPLFAYSMLYPYTDNLLDDMGIDTVKKKEFNARFRKRLMGERVEPVHQLEATIFELVSFIENHYSRKHYPRVYESLLAIHQGQEKSVLLNNGKSNSYECIAHITFEKGGTSVLADGYLVAGNLEPQTAGFLMSYGIFLQLLDDLQDIEEDLLQNQSTIFTHSLNFGNLDRPAVQLVDFMMNTLNRGEIYFPGKKDFFKIIRSSCFALTGKAVQRNRTYFSGEFVDFIEEKSGFSSSFYERQKEKFSAVDKKDMEKYLQHILTDGS